MSNHQNLAEQIAHYKATQRTVQKSILVVGTLLMGTGITTAHLITSYQYKKELIRHTKLTSQHTQYAHQWGAQQKIHKKIKQLKTLLTCIEPSQCSKFLQKISETIPDGTILHSFSYEDPQHIILTGYAATMHELASFMNRLRTGKLTKNRLLEGGCLFQMSCSLA